MTATATCVRIETGNGKAHVLTIQELKLLLRLRQLPDGRHILVLDKRGESRDWSVMGSGKVEG